MSENNFISQYAKEDWDGTNANSACQKACDAMLASAGFKSEGPSKTNIIVDNVDGGAGAANDNAQRIIGQMAANLYAGYPSKVSVDTKSGYSSHADMIGDHFVIIMGVTEQFSKGEVVGISYRFFEPGTRYVKFATSRNAVFTLSEGRLIGNAPYGKHRSYTVSSVRFCK